MKIKINLEVTPDGKEKPETMQIEMTTSEGFQDIFPMSSFSREIQKVARMKMQENEEREREREYFDRPIFGKDSEL